MSAPNDSPSPTSTPEPSKGRGGARRLRQVGWLLLILAGVALPLVARVAWEGRAELARAAEAREAQLVDLEVEHLGRAARWRLPLASHDDQAIARLMEIGREYEELEQAQTALMAYREVRRALLATRSWGVPRQDVFHEANRHIARLMADQERSFGTDLSGSGNQEAYHLELLEQVPGPSSWRANFAALAFIAWVAAVCGFVLRALDAHGRLRPRPALRWGGAALVLLIAWMVLLRFAG